MNELKRELLEAMGKVPLIRNEDDMLRDDYEGYAEACAKVCLRWIEKAYTEAYKTGWMNGTFPRATIPHSCSYKLSEWLKENNLI